MNKDITISSKRTKKRYIEITDQEYLRLRRESRSNPSVKIRQRCQAIILRAKWPSKKDEIIRTINDVRSILDISEKTIDRWISIFHNKGIEGLLKLNYKSVKGKLDNFREEICKDIDDGVFMTVDHIIDHIFNKFCISISRTQMRCFLRKNGFTWRMTGHIPGKADPKMQKEWLETIFKPALKDCQENGNHMYFSDAVHYVLGETCTKIWSRKRKYLKSSTGRNRMNVLGAANAITKFVITRNNKTYIDAKEVESFLEDLREHHPDNKIIYLIIDNARYQHCKLVMDKAESLNIKLLFLPPYSPNLNIIERLWRFSKRKVLYGKYFETPTLFHNAITEFYRTLNDKYQLELERLLTLEFQLFDEVA